MRFKSVERVDDFPINTKGDVVQAWVVDFHDHPKVWSINPKWQFLSDGVICHIDKHGSIWTKLN